MPQVHLRNDAATRIDAIEAGLQREAATTTDGRAAAWLASHAEALRHGCPAAQVVTYSALRYMECARAWLENPCPLVPSICPLLGCFL